MASDVYEAQKAQALQMIAQLLQHILNELRLSRQAQERIANKV